MNVCVVSGSPRGEYSVTLQTALYIQKHFPACAFTIVHAGQRIRSLEKDITPLREALESADIVLLCYPVYTFLAPSQLARAIELIKEAEIGLEGKFAAQITTSKHFFDVTAHRYIEENCADLGLKYLGGLSADMEDLLSEKGRREAKDFWSYVLWRAENGVYAPPVKPGAKERPAYTRELAERPKSGDKELVIVADLRPGEDALAAMVADFQAASPVNTRIVDIAAFPFAGGCLGCLRCASSETCVYKDGFDRFLRENIQQADGVVYAFTVCDHAMGARFKMFDDRQFCNGHRPVTAGKPVGYLVSGALEGERNLIDVLTARADVGGNFLCGFAGDAAGVKRLADTMQYALSTELKQPQSFFGVGGMKIFRDLIYVMRGFMRADHRFYKRHGLYDFPQRRLMTTLKMYLVGGLVSNPAVFKKMGNRMNVGMVAPYKKALEKE